MAWINISDSSFTLNCENIKKIKIQEAPHLFLEVWFSDNKESDFLIKPYDLEQAKAFKYDMEKAMKYSTIKVVK